MISEFYWKATSAFFAYADFPIKCPLQWNPKTKLFSLRQSKKDLLIWYFVIFILIGAVAMGTKLICLYLRIFIKPKKSFTILHKLSYVIITAIGCFPLLIALGCLIFGKESIVSLNQLICVNKDLTELHKSLTISSGKTKTLNR